jgi:hypothetical protein
MEENTMAEVDFYFIGIGDGCLSTVSETRKQIDAVKGLECHLEQEGKAMTWDDFEDPEGQPSLFKDILRDRLLRVDQNTRIRRRPGFCVITALNGKAVRLEYYGGLKLLSLQEDFRAKDLQDADLPNFLKEDPVKSQCQLSRLRVRAQYRTLKQSQGSA